MCCGDWPRTGCLSSLSGEVTNVFVFTASTCSFPLCVSLCFWLHNPPARRACIFEAARRRASGRVSSLRRRLSSRFPAKSPQVPRAGPCHGPPGAPTYPLLCRRLSTSPPCYPASWRPAPAASPPLGRGMPGSDLRRLLEIHPPSCRPAPPHSADPAGDGSPSWGRRDSGTAFVIRDRIRVDAPAPTASASAAAACPRRSCGWGRRRAALIVAMAVAEARERSAASCGRGRPADAAGACQSGSSLSGIVALAPLVPPHYNESQPGRRPSESAPRESKLSATAPGPAAWRAYHGAGRNRDLQLQVQTSNSLGHSFNG
jgi:hypothetical protein